MSINAITEHEEQSVSNVIAKEKSSQQSVDALGVVYQALLEAFSQQEKTQAEDIAVIKNSIFQQKKSNELLDAMNFATISSYEDMLAQKKEDFITSLKDLPFLYTFEGGLQKLSPQDYAEVVKHIRAGTMPSGDTRLHGIMDMVRGMWNNKDFVGEAKNDIKEKTEKAGIENTQITKLRENVSNDITIDQQQAQLASSYCQSTASRLTQTSSTFTALLAANKGAIEQIYR